MNHWDPGAEMGRHTPPGSTVSVFVRLEGELEETLADGSTRIIRPGQAFWNRSRWQHDVRNASGQSARGMAVHLDPAS